jgi:hypothetical protein
MCRAEFKLMPLMVVVCEACQDMRSCSFECIKRHRAEKHPHYRGSYNFKVDKVWPI